MTIDELVGGMRARVVACIEENGERVNPGEKTMYVIEIFKRCAKMLDETHGDLDDQTNCDRALRLTELHIEATKHADYMADQAEGRTFDKQRQADDHEETMKRLDNELQ